MIRVTVNICITQLRTSVCMGVEQAQLIVCNYALENTHSKEFPKSLTWQKMHSQEIWEISLLRKSQHTVELHG